MPGTPIYPTCRSRRSTRCSIVWTRRRWAATPSGPTSTWPMRLFRPACGRHCSRSMPFIPPAWPMARAIEVLQQALRLRVAPARDAHRVDRVDVKRGRTGVRMLDDGGMALLPPRLARRGDGRRHQMLDAIEIAALAIGHAGGMNGIERLQCLPQAGRKSLIGHVLVGPDGVAAHRRRVQTIEQRVDRRLRQVG